MERKIGEVFKFGGEWYQCVGNPYNECTDCDFCFETGRSCVRQLVGQCSMSNRSDGLSVVFKRLEKVGEPYEFDGHLFQSYHTFEVPIFTENYATVREFGNNSKISIEIKQTKEDMEENKLNLKPFDIQKAREGKPVCTRDGRKARIICFDAKGTHPIIALVSDPDIEGEEIPFCYTNDGFYNNPNYESNHDLMILPEKKEGWINLYKWSTPIYKSEEEAKACVGSEKMNEYIASVKVQWEE